MVYTRTTAPQSRAPRSTVPTREEPPIDDESETESSDEDDEGIPNQISLSARYNNGVVSLRPSKRPREDEPLPSGRSKRQRAGATGHVLGLRRGRLRLASYTSQPVARAVDRKEGSNKSTSPDAENDVSDDLVNCVSSILTSWNKPAQQKTPEESPRHQLPEEKTQLSLSKSGKDGTGYALQLQDGDHFEPPVHAKSDEHRDGLANTGTSNSEEDGSGVQDNAAALNDESHALEEDLGIVPDDDASRDAEESLPPVPHKPPRVQQDPYDIPSSPLPYVSLIKPSGLPPKGFRSRMTQPTESGLGANPSSPPVQVPRLYRGNIPSRMHAVVHENRNTQGRDKQSEAGKGSCVEADVGMGDPGMPFDAGVSALIGESLDWHKDDGNHTISDGDYEYHSVNDCHDDDYHDNVGSPIIHGIDFDDGNGSDVDLSAEESFSRDVYEFKNRHIPKGEVLTEGFDCPRKDDLNTVHVHRGKLKKALNLMRFKPWSKLRPGQSSSGAAMAVTQPGRHIMPLLAKLERLCLAAPRVPLLEEQNMFLAEYSDMVTYYFSKIDTIVSHIRTERLNQSNANQDEKKRSDMAEEVVSLIIPKIFQVLDSAWKLGGAREDKPLFTISTSEFLRRGVGWITRLYHRATGELEKHEPKFRYMKKWPEKIADLRPLLNELSDQTSDIPGLFLAKKYEKLEAQRKRKLQKETEMMRERDKRAEQQRVEEQNRRAFLSIERKSVSLRSPKSSESRAMSTVHQAPPWSREEEIFLFKQLKQAYPQLPDLVGHVQQELDRDLDDIKGKSRVLLRAMLEEACGDVGVAMSAADMEAEIENMFSSSTRL
ncbi:hypothetical protein SLS62_007293 [Diatrype stigma]|uniref:Uncharacterized protein n=1 Tax=Diatrype stigma TaxID=117547 RepID=A0AAN9UP71_9PEZI